MKKYKISKFYIGVYLFGLVFFALPGEIIAVYLLIHEINLEAIILSAIALMTTVAGLYSMMFDFQCGHFTVDEHGITMYVGVRLWPHSWEQITDAGIVGADVRDGNTYWVYFSECALSSEEKRVFLSKTRRDLKHIAFFQYNPEVFNEILPLLPPELAERLQYSLQFVVPRMSRIEKLYHK